MKQKIILCANWKMALGREPSKVLAGAFKGLQSKSNNPKVEVWIAPSAVFLSEVAAVLSGSALKVGGQNAHWELAGAFTGETSTGNIKDVGGEFCIIGHSERRHIFMEDQEAVTKRAAAVLKSGLQLIYCVGETLEERESSKTNQVLALQLAPIVENLTSNGLPQVIVAYEPVWAIGTGKVASLDDITQAHDFILAQFRAKFGNAGRQVPVLYGGSVKPENFAGIIALPAVSGALVGGASLTFESFQMLHMIALDS